jgi:hypothetical protein
MIFKEKQIPIPSLGPDKAKSLGSLWICWSLHGVYIWRMLQQSRVNPTWFRAEWSYSKASPIWFRAVGYSRVEQILHGSVESCTLQQSRKNPTWFRAICCSRTEWIPHGPELSTAKEQNESGLIYRLCCGRAEFPVVQWIQNGNVLQQSRRNPIWFRATEQKDSYLAQSCRQQRSRKNQYRNCFRPSCPSPRSLHLKEYRYSSIDLTQ